MLNFIDFVRVMKAAKQAKAPLVHSEALVWLHACVKDFGAGVLPVPQVVAFAVAELEHTNPKVGTTCRFLQSHRKHTGICLPSGLATCLVLPATLHDDEVEGKN